MSRFHLEHDNLTKESQDNLIYAKAKVFLETSEGIKIKLHETQVDEYYQASRTALMDTAYQLEQLARQMKSQAERMR